MDVPLVCEALYPSVSPRLNPTRGSSPCNAVSCFCVHTQILLKIVYELEILFEVILLYLVMMLVKMRADL